MADEFVAEVQRYAADRLAEAEAMRERVRAAAPDFTALVDRLRSKGESVKVIALVTADGQEFGKVDDEMRGRVRS